MVQSVLANVALGAVMLASAVLFFWILREMVTPEDSSKRRALEPAHDAGSLVALSVTASTLPDTAVSTAANDDGSSSSDSSDSSSSVD